MVQNLSSHGKKWIELSEPSEVADPQSPRPNPLRHVLRPLTGAEFDDAKLSQSVLVKRIFLDDGFDLLPAFADGQDDSAVSRDLPTGDQKMAGGVILLQESDMRRHVCVDFREVRFVDELDDKHGDHLGSEAS